jgi:hypothetical protein
VSLLLTLTVPQPNAVQSFGDELEEKLAPWMTPSLATFCQAIGVMFQPVRDLIYGEGVDGEPGFIPGWGRLFDPDLCPSAYLGYLAQFVGVSIPAGTGDAQARALIRQEAGIQRGTLAAIRAAVIRNLSGTQSCFINERLRVDGTPDAYQMVVVVRPEEVVSLTALTAAVDAVRPAGILVNYVQSDGFTWSSAIHLWSAEGTWDSFASTQP